MILSVTLVREAIVDPHKARNQQLTANHFGDEELRAYQVGSGAVL